MITTSAAFKSAVKGSHAAKVRVELRGTDGTLIESFSDEVLGGSVTIDASAAYRRQLALSLSQTVSGWAGSGGTGLLTGGRYGDMPRAYGARGQELSYGELAGSGGGGSVVSPLAGHELHVARGVVINGETEWVPLGVFHIASVRSVAGPGGAVEVTGYDRSRLLDLNAWTITRQADGTTPVHVEIANAITALLPQFAFELESVTTSDVPAAGSFVWELGARPWESITSLASAYGLEVIFDADGKPLIRELPALTGPSVWSFAAGSAGTLIERDMDQSDEGVTNAVLVLGTDGTKLAYAEDDDPGSLTYVQGPFGRRVQVVSLEQTLDALQATTYAEELLRRGVSKAQELTITAVPMPAIEPGDIVKVSDTAGIDGSFNVVSVTVPLDLQTPMSVLVRREVA